MRLMLLTCTILLFEYSSLALTCNTVDWSVRYRINAEKHALDQRWPSEIFTTRISINIASKMVMSFIIQVEIVILNYIVGRNCADDDVFMVII
jgi:hypothetical protein